MNHYITICWLCTLTDLLHSCYTYTVNDEHWTNIPHRIGRQNYCSSQGSCCIETPYYEDVWKSWAISPCILDLSTFQVSGYDLQFETHWSIRHKWKCSSTALLKLYGSSGIHMISYINKHTLLVCKGMIWLGMWCSRKCNTRNLNTLHLTVVCQEWHPICTFP